MFRQFIRTIVPHTVRAGIYNILLSSNVVVDICRQLEKSELEKSEIDSFVDLTAQHIENLRVFVDREAMLEAMPKQAVIAEIGVADGIFSEKIFAITNPRRLHLIDIWGGDIYTEEFMVCVQNKFKKQLESGQVVINRGYSVSELENFPDDYFDWVYIDTAHSYEMTIQELELCKDKVKGDGIIAGHDYIVGSWRLKVRYGVIEAVNEFCIKCGWEMIYLTHEGHRFLSFAIRKI